MADIDCSSLCSSHSRYVSQLEVVKVCRGKPVVIRRPALSATEPTFVHFLLYNQLHCGAVQISINPFSVVDFPGQTFFFCHYRYKNCCAKAPPSLGNTIKERVQQVYDALYGAGPWDFSKSECCTVDDPSRPSKISKASCTNEAGNSLRGYFKLVGKSQPLRFAIQQHEPSRIDEALGILQHGMQILQGRKSPNGKTQEAENTDPKRKTDELEPVNKRPRVTQQDQNIQPDLTCGRNEEKLLSLQKQELMFSWEEDIDIFAKNGGHSLSLPSESLFMQGQVFTNRHNSTSFEYASNLISDKGEPLLSLPQEAEERMFSWEIDLVCGDLLQFGTQGSAC